MIESSLSDAARKAFEMLPEAQRFFSESQRRSFEQGQLQSRAEDVVAVLEARKLAISDEQRKRILGCSDLDELDRCIRKAATIASTDELFAD